MPSRSWRIARLGFLGAVAALGVFTGLMLLGTWTLPPGPFQRLDEPWPNLWMWLLLSSVAGMGLGLLTTLIYGVIAAVSHWYRPPDP